MQVSQRFRFDVFPAVGALLVALLVGALVAAAPAAQSAPATRSYIVVLNDDVAHPANVAHRHEENRGAKLGHIYGVAIEGYSAELAPNELKAVKQDPNVDYVVPDGVVHADSQAPTDAFKRVFAHANPNLDVDEIDDVRTDVDVAILDSGVAFHPDLNVVSRTNCVWQGHPGAGCTNGGEGVFYHGTHVAGIVGALDNNFGVVGTAPGARIWSVKVLMDEDGEPQGDEVGNLLSDVVAGVNWVTARADQIEVVNMSFGCRDEIGDCNSTPLREAIAASVNKGVVYVAAAGNADINVNGDAINSSYAPARFPDVITVSALEDSDGAPGGAGGVPKCSYGGWTFPTSKGGEQQIPSTAQDDSLANFSNWGPAVDIAAPGTCIWSTVPGGGYKMASGTSMSAPMVAGAAAGLAAAKNPNNRAEVEAIYNLLRSLGNYSWTDTHQIQDPNQSPAEWALVGDGIQEPLLDMSIHSAPPQTPGAPIVAMGAVSNINESSATLAGTVNPGGVAARYDFECGRSGEAYPMRSSPEGLYLPAGSSPVPVSWTVTGLYPGASYHCRLSANNPALSFSAVVTFTTPMATSYVTPGGPAPLRVSNNEVEVFSRLAGVGDQLTFTRYTPGNWGVGNLNTGQPKMASSAAVIQMKAGGIHAFAPNTNGDLICFYKNVGGAWASVNLTQATGGLKLAPETPAVVESAPGQLSVFARATNNDLVSYERATGGYWTMFNESNATGGHPTTASSPVPVVLDPNRYNGTNLIVLARNAGNQLIAFSRLTSGGWLPYNITANTGVSILGNPAAVRLDPTVYAGSGLGVFARNANNELISFDRLMSGSWLTYNVTANSNGAVKILDTPAPIRLIPGSYADSVLGVYARTTGNDLVSFDRHTNGGWTTYNVSVANNYPKIAGPPSLARLEPSIYSGSGLGVYARNTNNELISFDRLTSGGWVFYNVTNNTSGKLKVE